MPVYAIGQFKIHDREGYDRYQAGFVPTMEGIDMRVLSATEDVTTVEGEWNADKLVLIEFKDKENFEKWLNSDAYQAIINDRISSADGPVILVNGLS